MPPAHLDFREFPVLFVDDEPANLTAFRYAFEEQFRIITAGSGPEALKVLASERVAVLVSDQRMPGMDGAQLCARARELHPDVVRMVVSAYADLSAALDAINAGQVSRYIVKPWREEEMATLLRTAIETFHLGALLRNLQTRLLQSEQLAGAQFMIKAVLQELSTPLHSLRLNLQFAADSLVGPGVASDIRDALADGLQAIGNLRERFEYFASGGGLNSHHGPRSTDLGRAVMSAVNILRTEVQSCAQLHLDIVPVGPVAIDAVQASQILINLLINAKESIKRGGGAPNANVITIRVRPTPGCALIEVEDTGAPAALAAEAFDERGLSLAIVRDIVANAGGRVAVESHPGKGSTFTVELPAAPPEPEQPVP